MFLVMLKDNQKELFMDLAINAAKANGDIEELEKEMLEKFAEEMDIKSRTETSKSFEESLDALAGVCDKKEKKIILFEVVGIMNADGNFNDEEKAFLSKVASKFEIKDSDLDYMMSLVTAYFGLFNNIAKTVIGE